LEHEDQMELIQRILKNAVLLYKYLPIFLGLGMSCILPRITDAELRDLHGVLNRAGDDRQGQLIRNFDRFFLSIHRLIVKYDLDPPLVFETGDVDRTALLHYSSDKKVQ
jgi:hypothetical protein